MAILRADSKRRKPKPGDPCPVCLGSGCVQDEMGYLECEACNGTGKTPVEEDSPDIAWDLDDEVVISRWL